MGDKCRHLLQIRFDMKRFVFKAFVVFRSLDFSMNGIYKAGLFNLDMVFFSLGDNPLI